MVVTLNTPQLFHREHILYTLHLFMNIMNTVNGLLILYKEHKQRAGQQKKNAVITGYC